LRFRVGLNCPLPQCGLGSERRVRLRIGGSGQHATSSNPVLPGPFLALPRVGGICGWLVGIEADWDWMNTGYIGGDT
jgi:hypothetical protein